MSIEARKVALAIEDLIDRKAEPGNREGQNEAFEDLVAALEELIRSAKEEQDDG